MTTIRTTAAISLLLFLASCSSWSDARTKREERESYKNTFYMKYLDLGSSLDREIMARIEALRVNPASPALHNELGALLFERHFPKDARHEFERAIKVDKRFYPARYNLALLELAEGNEGRAERQFRKVLRQKPGHPEAHFSLGLMYEKNGRRDAAIEHYAKAYTINPELLQIKRNPRIVESELVTASLLTVYDESRARGSVQFQAAPFGYVEPAPPTPPAELVPDAIEEPVPEAAPKVDTPPPGT